MDSFFSEPLFLAFVFFIAILIDFFYGEVPLRIHPVVYIGKFIDIFKNFHMGFSSISQLLLGFFLAFFLPLFFSGGLYLLLYITSNLYPLQIPIYIFFITSCFSLGFLGKECLRVKIFLDKNSLSEARLATSRICSRPSDSLNTEEICSATLESMSENICDSVVAPIFYFALAGLPGMMAYRVVNTMDAMIGYRGKYEYFGKTSARLDDLLNFIPARLTALLLLLTRVSRFTEVLKIIFRDRHKTLSPNSGHPMSAMAGLLRVQFIKKGVHQLGNPLESLKPDKILEAWILTRRTAFLSYGLCFVFFGASYVLEQ